jgi:large subunit ribosomal protein L23
MRRDPYTILKRPRITEKATAAFERNAYTFEILRDANKIEVRKAVESVYNVKVKSVNTMRVRGKLRRVGRNYGRTPDWKKAVVTLAEGQTLDIM